MFFYIEKRDGDHERVLLALSRLFVRLGKVFMIIYENVPCGSDGLPRRVSRGKVRFVLLMDNLICCSFQSIRYGGIKGSNTALIVI